MDRPTRAEDFELASLLDGIEAGSVVLPNFQRDFDWTVADVRALISTVLRGWPLGSLLLIQGESDRDFYDPRPFTDAPPMTGRVDLIVLDGQQRLTALFHALRDRGKFVYAVRLGLPLESIDDVDRAVVAIRRVDWPKTPPQQHSAGYIPVAALESAEKFYSWRDQALDLGDPSTVVEVTTKYREHLAGINGFKVPAVLIGTRVGPEAVARIFERVNRTGIKLGAFDLMVAKSFGPKFNLRALWDEAQRNNPALTRFLAGDGLPILTTLAMRAKYDVRQSAVLELTASAIHDGWHSALHHVERAIDFLTIRLGVLDPDWLPYRSMLPVLASVDFDLPLDQNTSLIERWYWLTAVGRRYDEGSNTAAVADFRSLVEGSDPIARPTHVIRDVALESSRGQQGAFHRTFLNALGREVLNHKELEEVIGNVRASTVFARDESKQYDPPLHLRTLGFYLAEGESRNSTWIPFRHQFGEMKDGDVLDSFSDRLDTFLTAVRSWTGENIPVVSTEQASREDLYFGSDDES